MSKNNQKKLKDEFIERFIYKKNILSVLLNIVAKVVLFFLNYIAIILIKISAFFGWLYTKIWPFLNASSYDHRFDYLRGVGNFGWYERAILAKQKIKFNGKVLDIGCGDGIYSGIFYSDIAKKIDAIDIDKAAIEHAKRYYRKNNVKFVNNSVQNWFKNNRKYDTILMFAVIEHFEPDEGLAILQNIKESLSGNGVFFGSTPLFKDNGAYNFEHKNEFHSEIDLYKFLRKVFRKVNLYISVWPNNRNECYFECKI